MSHQRKDRLINALFCSVPTALISAGLSLFMLSAVTAAMPVWSIVLYAALSSVLFCLSQCLSSKWRHWAFAALGIGLLLTAVFGTEPGHSLYQAGRAVYLSLQGVENALLPYRGVLFRAAPVFLSLILFNLSDLEETYFFSSLCCLLVLVTYVFSGGQGNYVFLIPVLTGLMMHFSMSQTNWFFVPALIVCAALTAAAFFITPSSGVTSQTLADAADDLRETINDYFYRTDGRAGFTLATEGFLPLTDRLGGSVQPETHTVLEVDTDEMLYLRAVAYNEYNGLTWKDTLSAQRYHWSTLYYKDLKNSLFDESLPNADLPLKTATVHVLRDCTTTLFLPWRVQTLDLQGERMVPYFNRGTEIFITRFLTAGDVYTFTYKDADIEDESVQALAAANETIDDPRYEEVCGQYLSVPSHMQTEVYDISRTAAGNAATALQKALSIRDYLSKNYTYSLEVSTPPDNVDFVTWFLLREKQGYCSYFASAFTILCRMAGVPARYVTGFLVEPDESGKAIVTGEDAHAWTEIYLNGVGWVTLDATPAVNGENGNTAGDADHPDGNSAENTPTPTPTPAEEGEDGQDGMNTPSPDEEGEDGSQSGTNTPTPTPSLSSDEEGENDTDNSNDEDESQDDNDESNDTDDGESSDDPNAGSESDNPDDPNAQGTDSPKSRSAFWLWLLGIALFVLLIIFLLRWTNPINRARRHPDRAPEILMAAILSMLAADGHRRTASDTLSTYIAQAAPFYPTIPLTRLVTDYEAALYGHKRISPAAFFTACRTLQTLRPFSIRRYFAGRRRYGKQ